MSKVLGLFWLQFRVLIWKNWIVISKTPFVSALVVTLVTDILTRRLAICFAMFSPTHSLRSFPVFCAIFGS